MTTALRFFPFSLLCFGLALASCHWARSNSEAAAELPPEAAFVQFYVLHISRDSTAEVPRSQVKLLKTVRGKGQMKSGAATEPPGEDYLTVYRRAGKKTLDSAVLAHPLFLHLEYSDEAGLPAGAGAEAGRFTRKEVTLDTAQFFLRLPGRQGVDNLRVTETLRSGAKTELGILKIFEQ